MKLSHRYLNKLCKFYLTDFSEVYGIISPFFMSKYGNQLFLIYASDIQNMEFEAGAKSAQINFDVLSEVIISRYFHRISEDQILLAKTLREPSIYDNLLGSNESIEKFWLAILAIELKYLDFFKNGQPLDSAEEHDRLFSHIRIFTEHPKVWLTIDDGIPEHIKFECEQAFKSIFKESI